MKTPPSTSWHVPVMLAVLLVSLAIAAWVTSSWHERHMAATAEGFLGTLEAGKEPFDASMQSPSAPQQSRKTSAYLNQGLAQFFSSGSQAVVAAAVANYLVYFQPTASDLTCDFTQGIKASCLSLIDTIASVDLTTNFPATYLYDLDQLNSTVVAPAKSVDSNVYVLGSLYAMSKVSIRAHAFVFVSPKAASNDPVQLALPRGTYATRLLMLLRPLYIRAANSMLYWVDYGAPGTDGMSYDSDAAGAPNAVLSLVPVTDSSIDQGTMPIQSVINPTTNASPFSPPRKPPVSAAVAPVSRSSFVSLVLYYPRFLSANSQLPPGTPCQVASVAARVSTTTTVNVADSSGNNVLSISRSGALSDSFAIMANGQGPLQVPAIGAGIVVVTFSYDTVVAACFDTNRTSIRCYRGLPTLGYTPNPEAPCSAAATTDLMQVLPPYTCQSIPNLADIALRSGSLAETSADASVASSELSSQAGGPAVWSAGVGAGD